MDELPIEKRIMCLLSPPSQEGHLTVSDARWIAGQLSKLETHRQFMADVSEDMECPPECDSYGHRENCPVTNPMEAWRQLRSKLDHLRKALKRIESPSIDCVIEGRIDVTKLRKIAMEALSDE